MHGQLYHYKGLVGGFKQLYGVIEGSDFVCYKNSKPQEKDEYIRIKLDVNKQPNVLDQ